jgi:hypothetical protein
MLFESHANEHKLLSLINFQINKLQNRVNKAAEFSGVFPLHWLKSESTGKWVMLRGKTVSLIIFGVP